MTSKGGGERVHRQKKVPCEIERARPRVGNLCSPFLFIRDPLLFGLVVDFEVEFEFEDNF